MKQYMKQLKVVLLFSLLSTTCFANAQQAIFKTGEMQVEMLIDEVMDGDTSILQNATPELINKYIPTGKIPMPVTSALIQDSNGVILIDTGLGNKLAQHLQERNIKPDDVKTILMTHMHFDHFNGLLSDGKVLFPNAKLYIAEKELAYWADDNNINTYPEEQRESMTGYFKGSQAIFAAYKDQIVTFAPGELSENGKEILPNINAIAAYGHTAGHTVFLLNPKADNKLMILGDIIHAGQIQFAHPEVTVVYDTDPNEAAKTRKAIFKYISTNAIPVAAMHQSNPIFGTLKPHAEEKEGYVFNTLN